jgi:hypothetical protein
VFVSDRDHCGIEVDGADWQREGAGFWVAGAVVLCLLAAHVVIGSALGFQEKTYDLSLYVLVGLGAPVAAIGLPVVWGWLGWPAPWAPRLKTGLALIGILGACAFVAVVWARFGMVAIMVTVLLALLQTVAIEGVNGTGPSMTRLPLSALLASLVAWSVAVSLGLLELLTSFPAIAAFATIFLVLVTALTVCAAKHTALPHPGRLANVAALLVILVLSLRTEHLFDILGERGAIHHWGAWTGTIDLMRQGGWLLWDTPAHYGFLSMILLDTIPAPSWTALYWASAAAYVLVATGIFAVARTIRPGWPGWVFGLGAGCFVAMYSARPDIHVLPNYGAYRYLPGFLLLMVLVAETRIDEDSVAHRRLMIGGCVLWVIGALWAPDSLVYCSAAWLPAYFVMSVRQNARRADSSLSNLFRMLALPVILIAAAVIAVQVIWTLKLGHGPDWIAYVDYVIGPAATQALVEKQVLIGSGVLILLGLSVLTTDAAIDGVRSGLPARSLAAWLGMLGLYWGINIYTQQRALEVLQPLAYAVLVIAVVEAARAQARGERWWPAMTRAAIVPIFILPATWQLGTLYADPGAPGASLTALAATARHGFTIEWMMPDADPELQKLLRDSGVTADTPLLYGADWLGNMMMPWTPAGETERTIVNPQWTPNHPGTMAHYLPDDRYRRYLERFLERDGRGGWLIQARTGDYASDEAFAYAAGLKGEVFYDTVLASHVPTLVRQSENWNITWWEPAGPPATRPQFLTGYMQPLPLDVLVDGVALSDAAAPEVWAVLGPGWGGVSGATADGRLGRAGVQLWIYSPVERSVRFDVPVIKAPGRMDVRLNGEGLTTPDRVLTAEIDLDAGWTPVTFTLVDQEPRERKQDAANRSASPAEPGNTAKPKSSGLPKEAGEEEAKGSGRAENRPKATPSASRSDESGVGKRRAATPETAGATGSATPEQGQVSPPGNHKGAAAEEGPQSRSFVIGPISITTMP